MGSCCPSLCHCCRTCACPQQKDTAIGRRHLLSEKGIDIYLRDWPCSARANVKVTTEYIEKPSGQIAHTKLFQPLNPADAKGMICYSVGFADHMEWFAHDVGCSYAEKGFVVFMIEHKGHGRTDGEFAVITDFETEIVDEAIWLFFNAIDRYIRPHPVYSQTIDKDNNYFLSGASMGGAITIMVALKLQQRASNPFKGLVIVCPMVAVAPENTPPQWQIWFLQKCLLPLCPFAKLVPNQLKDTLTENEEAQRRLDANPLFYDQSLPLCTGNELLHTTLNIQKRAIELTMPIMVCHGDTDIVTDSGRSAMFCRECGCDERDKVFKLYEGVGHLLYEEAPEVFTDSTEWMMQRLHVSSSQGKTEKKDNDEMKEAVDEPQRATNLSKIELLKNQLNDVNQLLTQSGDIEEMKAVGVVRASSHEPLLDQDEE